MFSQNFVNAAPRKASVKRAGNTKKGSSSSSAAKSKTKRAATNKASTKRAASNKKTSTKRAQSRRKSGGSASSAATTNPVTNTASSQSVASNVCPVGTFLKRKYNDDSGEYTYYSAKTTECSLPEDDIVNVMTWEKANKANYPKTLQLKPSWISESEASFLICVPGYVERTVDKVKTCVSVLQICPINEIVEKSGKVYINPDTQEECMAPEKSVIKNVKGDENTLSYTLADESAYKFECPANYYPVADSETSIKVKCEMCPSGSSSPKGSSSVKDCVNAAAEAEAAEAAKKAAEEEEAAKKQAAEEAAKKQAEADAAAKQQAESANEASRLAKLRIKKVEGSSDDYTCVDGWTNNWAESNSTFKEGVVMDKDGKIKNVVDRNNYGKNKRGCPIKLDVYHYFDGNGLNVRSLDKRYGNIPAKASNIRFPSSYNYDLKVRDCTTHTSNYFPSKLGILKKKMSSSDIDNTGVNGWTEAEYEAWGGYRPVIGYYHDLSKLDGKKRVDNCYSNIFKQINSYELYNINPSYIKEVEDNLTQKALFTHWN